LRPRLQAVSTQLRSNMLLRRTAVRPRHNMQVRLASKVPRSGQLRKLSSTLSHAPPTLTTEEITAAAADPQSNDLKINRFN
jgi:hypothetical protein